MSDPVLIAAMVLLAALLELAPRRLVPFGAVLAIGVILADDGDDLLGVFALAGSAGVALASIGTALEARRERNRAGASPFAQAQREALRARLSSSGAYARIAFLMAALPGPTGKMLYPLIGAMRAPLLPAVAGTILGRTAVLAFTTWLFTALARALSNDETGAAQFLVSVIVALVILRTINSIDWEHRAREGRWRFRDSAADQMSARMFTGGVPGAMPGFDPNDPTGAARTRAGARENAGHGDVIEGDVIGEEIVDDEDAASDQPSDGGPSGELPRGS